MKTFIYIVCGFSVAWLIAWLIERRRLRPYWSRACTGGHWRGHFPRASKSEIRQFLDVFTGAFGFSRSRRLHFRPEDRVIDIYRILYPPKWTLADSMELESFAEDFRKTYGIDLVPLWREDITLADLFALARPKSAEPSTGANAG